MIDHALTALHLVNGTMWGEGQWGRWRLETLGDNTGLVPYWRWNTMVAGDAKGRRWAQRPEASREAPSTTALTLSTSEPQLPRLWKGGFKHLPHGSLWAWTAGPSVLCLAPRKQSGHPDVLTTPYARWFPGLRNHGQQHWWQQPQEQAPLRSTLWALDQALPPHLSATTLSGAHFKVEHSMPTSSHCTEDMVASAPPISLRSHDHRLCMKFSLAAQQGLLRFLPALPFSLFSWKEHLGKLAIKTPPLCP